VHGAELASMRHERSNYSWRITSLELCELLSLQNHYRANLFIRVEVEKARCKCSILLYRRTQVNVISACL
jgi:hypothetical protein